VVEIIVVNDGSSDDMPRILDQVAACHPEISALHLMKNHGFGGAVRAGLARVTQPLVMFCPADYVFTDRDFETYFVMIKYSDVVIGYRRNRYLSLSLRQRLSSTVYHFLVNTLFGLNFFDVNWIHMYHREHLNLITGKSEGAFLLAENLISATENGLRVVGIDVGIEARKAGEATGVKLKTILTCFLEMLSYYLKSHRGAKRS
jgi:glycosyltransferase involved in cell wall biosynthesis